MSAKIADWKTAISEIVAANWQRNVRLSPLSFIGTELRKRDVTLPDDMGLLRAAQSIEGLKAVQRPGHPLVWGLYPADAELGDDLEQYFRSTGGGGEGPQFLRFIWLAFKTEIGGDDRRVIDFAQETFFDDALDTPLQADQYLLTRPDQLPPSERTDKDRMASQINAWLKKNNLTERGLQTAAAPRSEQDGEQHGVRSLLFVLLDNLSERDLAKLNFPLDIIDKLRKTAI